MAHPIITTNLKNDELAQFLKSNNVSGQVVKKLIDGGLNSLHLLRAIDFDHHDWDDLAKQIGLNSLHKLQLKAAIAPSQKARILVTKEETTAIQKIKNKIKSMKSSIDLIDIINRDIDINEGTKAIKSRFNKIHSLLSQKELILIRKLKTVDVNKKEKLESIQNQLNTLWIEYKKQAEIQSKQLIKPMKLNQVEDRKKQIISLANDIDTINIVITIDPLATSINETSINRVIESINDLSLTSNNTSIDIKDNYYNHNNIDILDSFDTLYTGSDLKLNRNSIYLLGSSQQSSYLKRVVSQAINIWRYRIDSYKSGNQMIGIWNTKYQPFNKSTFLWDNNVSENQLYGFAFNSTDEEYHWVYNGSERKQYGLYIRNGDIIEMILDLNNLCLIFKINNQNYGKAFDVVAGSYRAAVTLNTDQTKFTLLSYNQT